jgi:hypothetical protein
MAYNTIFRKLTLLNMAKPFNQLLHDDILMLKGINREEFPDEFKRVFKNIMKRYSLSRTTVYAELEKSVPGAYRKYEGKSRHIIIGKKEAGMIKEMLDSGKSQRHIAREMSLELGFRYSHYRIYKVKEMLLTDSNNTLQAAGGEHILEVSASDASARLLNPDAKIEPAAPSEPVEFKGNISRFFSRLSMLNLIEPERKIKIKVSGTDYSVNSRVIKDCLRHITYSANSGGKTIGALCRFDMETILAGELSMVKQGNKLSPSAIKQLEGIRKSLLNSSPFPGDDSSPAGGYTLDDIYRGVRQFAQDARDVAKFMSSVKFEALMLTGC